MGAVVITGARGYIGSALARRLALEGRALRLVSRSSNAPRINAGLASVEYVQCDLRDEKAWTRLVDGASAVVHLSSRTDLRSAEADPKNDEAINIDPVQALVRAIRARGQTPKVVFASTVTIVGPHPDNPVNEHTPDNPCSVYDRNKLACEATLGEATREGLLKACSLRLSNVYGPGTSVNSNRGVLNVMMHHALAGKPLTLYGDGHYVRDFTYLDDVVEAFIAAIDSEICDGSHYVISTGQGYTLAEAWRLIAKQALSLTGQRAEIVHVPEPADLHPIERRNFIGDSSLFTCRTGWQAKTMLAIGIRNFMAAAMRKEILSQ